MTTSMTAFGRTDEFNDVGHIIWEIRTVNHRYLEISARLPDELRMLEAGVRERISDKIKRGKVDCVLKFTQEPESTTEGLSLNEELIHAIIRSAEKIRSILKNTDNINPMDVLRWPYVINRDTPDPEKIGGPLLDQLDRTLDIVTDTRKREGEKLNTFVLDRCNQMTEIISGLKTRLPDIMTGMREKLLERANELGIQLDVDRLEQEILLLTQKYDITEEVDRLEAHLEEVEDVLNKKGPKGRRLDFLMQELNRECNTLGSKSAHFDLNHASVNLKVLVEQMREQIQNIE